MRRKGSMMRFLGFSAALVLFCTGCGDARTQPPAATPEPVIELGAQFDRAAARTLRGRVTWVGELPSVPPFKIQFNADSSLALREALERPNPHAPAIDPAHRGIRDVIVFLRGIDPKQSKPWDHAAVTVEIRGRQYHVIQGDSDARSGFVRAGETITMVSKESECHSLHATGATFFTLSFPDPDQPLTRRLSEPGVMELCSNAGFFWMRAHLFVAEHPYFTRTDANGRFALKDVPPGEYELVAWLPNWKVKNYDRDPETGFRSRVHFAAPIEVVQKVRISVEDPRESVIEVFGSLLP
jgi:hypothetical protein